MERHPIENIMSSTMENIRGMVDVNTVIGEAIVTQDGSTVIPFSRVSFGFVAGGGEYRCAPQPKPPEGECGRLPFAGGTGAGVTLQPVGFLVTSANSVRLLPAPSLRPRRPHHRARAATHREVKDFLHAKNERRAPAQTPPQPVAP